MVNDSNETAEYYEIAERKMLFIFTKFMFFTNYFHSTITFLCILQHFSFCSAAGSCLLFFFFFSVDMLLFCVCVTFFKKKNRVYFLLTIQTWSYTHRNSENSSLGFVSFSFSEMVKSHFLESLNKKCRRRWICLFIARCNGLIHNLAREKKTKIKRLVSIFFFFSSWYIFPFSLLTSYRCYRSLRFSVFGLQFALLNTHRKYFFFAASVSFIPLLVPLFYLLYPLWIW